MAALEAAVDFLGLIGMPRIEARMRMLASRAMAQLREVPGVELKTSPEPALSAGVVKFRLAKTPTKQAYDALWTRHRLAIAMTPTGDAEGLRFSPHI